MNEVDWLKYMSFFEWNLQAGLFIYDIFWVFCTPVMVSVAKSFDAPIKVLNLLLSTCFRFSNISWSWLFEYGLVKEIKFLIISFVDILLCVNG